MNVIVLLKKLTTRGYEGAFTVYKSPYRIKKMAWDGVQGRSTMVFLWPAGGCLPWRLAIPHLSLVSAHLHSFKRGLVSWTGQWNSVHAKNRSYLLLVVWCVWQHGGNMEHDFIVLICCIKRMGAGGVSCNLNNIKKKIQFMTTVYRHIICKGVYVHFRTITNMAKIH